MTRILIDTAEKAQALVGQLVQFSWGSFICDPNFRGAVARYISPERPEWGMGLATITQADGAETELYVPSPNFPIFAEAFDPEHPDSLDRSPLPASGYL